MTTELISVKPLSTRTAGGPFFGAPCRVATSLRNTKRSNVIGDDR